MKTIIVSAALFALSFSTYAKVSKETWSCQNAHGDKVLSATFTPKSSTAKLSKQFDQTDEDVALTFARQSQKTALNGTERTELTGNTISGRDSFNYEVTLIRSRLEDYDYNGKAPVEVAGQAIVVTEADIDCAGRGVSAVTLECKISVEH